MKKIKKYATEDRFVAFIDILGFKDIVMKNKNPEKIMIALETAKEKIINKNSSIVTSSNFSLLSRDYVKDSLFVEYINIGYDVDESYMVNSTCDLENLCNFEEFEDLKITWFSDSLILSIKADCLDNLSFLIEVIKNLQANLFSHKILLRGAITKDEFHHGDNAVYGKAMITAYTLESKKVVTPRVILSKELVNHINYLGNEYKKQLDYNMTYDLQYTRYINTDVSSDIAEMWGYKKTKSELLFEELLIKDVDDLYFIDYLKPLFYDIAICCSYESTLFPTKKFSACKKFIESEIKNEDMGISLKYRWLKNYFDNTLNKIELLFNKSFESFNKTP